MTTLNLDNNQLRHLARLLMGAAHSDGEFDGFEAGEISDILEETVDGELPSAVSLDMAKFDTAAFDVQDSCNQLGLANDDERRAVVALITRVTEADSLHDLAESAYIRQVVAALGGDLNEYEAHMFDVVVVKPPPLPGS